MKTKKIYWFIGIVCTLFGLEVFSSGNGSGATSRPFSCDAGQHAELLREGRSVRSVCVPNPPVVASEPSPTVSTGTTVPSSKRRVAKKSAMKSQKDPCDKGDGFVTKKDENGVEGCYPPEKSEEMRARENSNGIAVEESQPASPPPATTATAVATEAPAAQALGEVGDDGEDGTGRGANVTNCGCPMNTLCKVNANPSQFEAADIVRTGSYKQTINGGNLTQDVPHLCVKVGATSSVDGDCYTQFQKERDTCLAKASEASTTCDEENETMQSAANVTKIIGAGSAVSIQMACSKLGEISKVANVGFGAWQSACALSQKTCESSCTNAQKLSAQVGCIPPQVGDSKILFDKDMGTIGANVNKCVSYKAKINLAAQHAITALAQLQASKQCQTDSSSLTTNNLDQCKTNPNSPLCTDAQRCSNADFAAKNQVCKCINTPNAADCIAKTSAAGTARGVAAAGLNPLGTGAGGVDAGPTMVGADQLGGATGGFANSLREGAADKGNSANLGGQKGNAGVGGAGGSGSGGGGAAGHGGPGSPDTADKTKVNSGGFYGGNQAGGGGYLGKANGLASGSSRPNAGGINYNKMAGAQFDPRRYIAGLNGKSGEYINGPGLDLFAIVKNRIEANRPSLLDPNYKK